LADLDTIFALSAGASLLGRQRSPAVPHRPRFEYIPAVGKRTFLFKIDRDVWPVYHFHPELDLLLILKNTGTYVSGDHVGRMEPGTLILNGPNIPHALHPAEPDEEDWARPAVGVIQFSAETLGAELLGREEMAPVRQFLDDAARGFEFHGRTRRDAAARILAMRDQDGLERLAGFLLLLRELARSTERTPLASPGYRPSRRAGQIERVDRVMRYLQQRFAEPILLDEVAAVAHLTPAAFCRFFKASVGKTLVQYLHELRVGHACRLLLETDRSVSEVALESGFSNLSNFHRRFREQKGLCPGEFRAAARGRPEAETRPLPAARRYG
jgi:AraC-like DNA-binding protein